ncbi:tRNA (adenosine(37)-N6)-dimethylallyltransferase MiaA [Shimia thalassica]|uniref:tRNA (adenosine(37)-N6)-dimethylallyltransferase MiaA n=1 Tax=Shimia thalassica TaxID=1715693 RepID=UPI001C08C785|nr:tRNA (adenosine(37)-N6)-dimethylallyltransferase MiaA [Shimia thalassica]MBU2944007.1 tRNA (adenosine(37)-N6)-dimethylallyltransferase MiaA [Shimia thalassica]MDO6503520.1 tRNA (adenosine(37)-N6)-dimethylallyltransferase MiaA [Shimia thalassica]
MSTLPQISSEQPVLIAGPTASGKSALALEIAEQQGGVIVNADAIQVYDNWRILTARPPKEDELRAPHALYGHLPYDAEYSVGHWLREVAPLLEAGKRPIITGGTGLYFTALTQGLAHIPPTPPKIRAEADTRVASEGFRALLAELDSQTTQRIDQLNPMRVQRAWEVLRATGRPLAAWQDDTPAPMLAETDCVPILFDVDREWLNARIARRFQMMLDLGALDEARDNLERWDPSLLSSKAIGAPELIAHLRGELPLDEAQERATIATRQFAKRQRTWFRSKMKSWFKFQPESAA